MRIALVVALLALTGCRPWLPASAEYADADHGYAVSLPAGWHLATERMSRITNPRELLTVSTVSLSWRATDCEAFAGAAGESMGARDVVVTLWERRGGKDFPLRPDRFELAADLKPAGQGCGEPAGTVIHWRDFNDSGRKFHLLVRIGPEAAPGDVDAAWRILDGLVLSAR